MVDARDATANVDRKGIAFTIDPAKKIRLTMMYQASCGRNSAEVLRVVDFVGDGGWEGGSRRPLIGRWGNM